MSAIRSLGAPGEDDIFVEVARLFLEAAAGALSPSRIHLKLAVLSLTLSSLVPRLQQAARRAVIEDSRRSERRPLSVRRSAPASAPATVAPDTNLWASDPATPARSSAPVKRSPVDVSSLNLPGSRGYRSASTDDWPARGFRHPARFVSRCPDDCVPGLGDPFRGLPASYRFVDARIHPHSRAGCRRGTARSRSPGRRWERAPCRRCDRWRCSDSWIACSAAIRCPSMFA